jgi:transposase
MIYAEDGKLNIDNPRDPMDNPVENSIRPVAVGRKNYLFAPKEVIKIKFLC